MTPNFVLFNIKNFENKQRELIEKYNSYFNSSRLETEILNWNRENFLGLFNDIEMMCETHNIKVVRSRLFFTPPGKDLEPHIDGKYYTDEYWALNFPILIPETNNWQIWYSYDDELKIDNNRIYQNSIKPMYPEKLVETSRLYLDNPYFVKVGVFHSVVNHSDFNRLILSIRFDKLNFSKITDIVRE